MSNRSSSTLDRDHQRAIDHKARLKIYEMSTIDWETVEDYEIEEIIDELRDLESEVEDDSLSEQLRELLDLLDELD